MSESQEPQASTGNFVMVMWESSAQVVHIHDLRLQTAVHQRTERVINSSSGVETETDYYEYMGFGEFQDWALKHANLPNGEIHAMWWANITGDHRRKKFDGYQCEVQAMVVETASQGLPAKVVETAAAPIDIEDSLPEADVIVQVDPPHSHFPPIVDERVGVDPYSDAQPFEDFAETMAYEDNGRVLESGLCSTPPPPPPHTLTSTSSSSTATPSPVILPVQDSLPIENVWLKRLRSSDNLGGFPPVSQRCKTQHAP